MIIVTWKFSVTSGSVPEGLEWAKSIMTYMKKEKLAPSKWWVLRPRSGDISRFSMVAQFASMAQFEAHIAKRDADPGCQAHRKERLEAGWTTGIEIIFSEVFVEG